LEGDLSAKFTGTLHRSRLEGKRLVAEVGLNLNDGDHVSGRFDGRFDAGTAAFDGEVTGTIQRKKPSGASAVKLLAKGWLRPDRMINIAQVEEGIPVGGVSFQIQVPLPKETPFGKLPPTGTKIEPGKTAEGHGSGAAKLG
jgi:hypothetical protein